MDGAGTWHLAFAAWVGAALCKNHTGAQSFKGTRSPEVGKGPRKEETRANDGEAGASGNAGTDLRGGSEDGCRKAEGNQRGFLLISSSLPSFRSSPPPSPALDKEALLLFVGRRRKEPAGETTAAADEGQGWRRVWCWAGSWTLEKWADSMRGEEHG